MKNLLTALLVLISANSFALGSNDVVSSKIKNSVAKYTNYMEQPSELSAIIQKNILSGNTTPQAITDLITDNITMIHQLELLSYFVEDDNMKVVSLTAINRKSATLEFRVKPFLSVMFNKLEVNEQVHKQTMELYNRINNARNYQDKEDMVVARYNKINKDMATFNAFLVNNLNITEKELYALSR